LRFCCWWFFWTYLSTWRTIISWFLNDFFSPELECEKLIFWQTFSLIQLTTLLYQFSNLYVFDTFRQNQLNYQLLFKLFLIWGFPRSLSHHHLVHDDSQWKNISFAGIVSLEDGFRSHVQRCSHVDPILEAILRLNRKAKIRNFPFVSSITQKIPILSMLAGFISRCMMCCELR
jgi:hypothetical protein